MRRATLIVFSVLALLLTAGGAAGQDEPNPPPEQSRRRSVEILAHTEQPEGHQSWLRHHLDRIHIDDETGFAYTRSLSVADHKVAFSLRGPALDTKRVGLSLLIRF